MKEFRIFVGLSEDSLVQVLHAALADSTKPETFSIGHGHTTGAYLPCRYVKIFPVS